MLFTDIHETIYMSDGGVLSFSPLHISTTKKAHDFQGKLNSKRQKGKPASQKLQGGLSHKSISVLPSQDTQF